MVHSFPTRRSSDLGITDITLCGLAKRLEEVWLPGEAFPVILPRSSEGLYLLQRVRDEAHRFAIAFHRERRSKRMTASALDAIPGLGATRRKALLTHFGSLKRLAAATPEEIAAVPGIGPRTAEAIVAAFGPGSPDEGSASPDEGSAVHVHADRGGTGPGVDPDQVAELVDQDQAASTGRLVGRDGDP